MAAFVIVALAVALRISWVLLVPSKPVGDFAMYQESAAYLLAHGALDPEFVYMPGYVFLLAGVQALGGGWRAARLLGAVIGGLGVAPVVGITGRLWDRRAAQVAGILYALWPAGIAMTSVTGTDLPTAVVIATALYLLVRGSDATHPLRGALWFGVAMGLAAYLRAVALPLAAGAGLYLLARRTSLTVAVKGAAVACLTAGLVLLPWGLRNRARYGEFFLTDSHGGLTALVGANPNSQGTYSRSLNLVFQEVSGFTLLHEPHRQADQASYRMAKEWTGFSPAYAAGLVVLKAERLLALERSLLYWPIFRQGVLPPHLRFFFAQWRRPLEALTDAFWWLLLATALAGYGIACGQRRWTALIPIPFQLGLCAIYVLFFAEVRYHLPIAALLFPSAAGFLVTVWDQLRGRSAWPRRRFIAWTVTSVGGVTLLWTAAVAEGGQLREAHRFAVQLCHVAGTARTCLWRGARRDATGIHDAGISGVYDGVGLWRHWPAGVTGLATTTLDLPGGRYGWSALLDEAPYPPRTGTSEGVVQLGDARIAPWVQISLPELDEIGRLALAGHFVHPGGPLSLTFSLSGGGAGPEEGSGRIWLSDLRLVREGPPSSSPD